MSININSETSCRNAYLNYYCHNNSMNITDEEIAEIKNKWSGKLTSWQASVSNDDNEYDFGDDDDLTSPKDKVAQQVEKDTGFDGEDDSSSSKISSGVNFLGGLCGSVMGVVASITALSSKYKGNVVSNPYTSAVIGTILMANAIYLKTAKPNKEAAEACQQLTQEHLPNAQAALAETQSDMEDSVDELSDLSDDAAATNEEANSDIKDKKGDYDAYKTSFENLKAKVESGEPLTEEEKSLWQSLVQYMTLIGEDIETIQTDTSDAVGKIYEDMETHQETFDYAAETMEEVEGVTEYAEGFDEATKSNANLVKISSIVGTVGAAGVVSSGIQAVATAGLNVAQHIAGGVAIATGGTAGVLFTQIAGEQGNYKDMASTEIDLRRETQDLNNETSDLYDDDLDAFDNFKTDVEDLELEIPDEIAPPEETAPPTTPSDGFPTGTPDALKPTGQNGTTGNNGSTPQAGGATPQAGGTTQQGEATQGGTQPATGGTNAQPAATQPLFTAGAAPVPGNSNMPKIVLPAECATAITSAQGLPMATNGNAFDPAIIPDIIAKLAPEYDIQTIQNVLNGVQTPANQGVNGNEDTNQPDLQGLKNKIALYKPLLQQAAINGWKC